MVFAVKEVKKKCEICGKEFEYKTFGENMDFSPTHEIHDIDNGKLIGIHIMNHFICKDCSSKLIKWIVEEYKRGD